MIQNRYQDKLRDGNQSIINLQPSNSVHRIELSLEIKMAAQQLKDPKVLEIGIGEGDLTKYILKNNEGMRLDALDVSEEMIAISKNVLANDLDRINFICQDALEYLSQIDFKYDIIVSAWTIHNFKWEDKEKLFKKIYECLNENGKFMMMDKIYPDDINEQQRLRNIQLARYHKYLEADFKGIIDHETQDYDPNYRMEETQIINSLKNIGFKNIEIMDKIERDGILIAQR